LKEARIRGQFLRTWEGRIYMGKKELLPKPHSSAHWPEAWRNGASQRNMMSRSRLYQKKKKKNKKKKKEGKRKRKYWIVLPTILGIKGFRRSKIIFGLFGTLRLRGQSIYRLIKVP